FRLYDDLVRKFITRDPSGYPDGPNNYLYVSNNPINKIDPLGLRSKEQAEEWAKIMEEANQRRKDIESGKVDQTPNEAYITSLKDSAKSTVDTAVDTVKSLPHLGDAVAERILDGSAGEDIMSLPGNIAKVPGNMLRDGQRHMDNAINNEQMDIVEKILSVVAAIGIAADGALIVKGGAEAIRKGSVAGVGKQVDASMMKELDGGGSWLMTEKQHLDHIKGKDMIGRSDGQYMTSSKQMNELISRTNGDTAALAEALGTDWQAGQKLIRVDVNNPKDFNVRLPDADSSGANSKFKSGGKTSGGTSEVVTDQIPADQVWTTEVK
ncbi:MAG: hypothetical protein HRT88_21310, partial [Lentisphaeraceae bacterium]|nr:hypothetical protein [Lentisphaeraceae bacterium]